MITETRRAGVIISTRGDSWRARLPQHSLVVLVCALAWVGDAAVAPLPAAAQTSCGVLTPTEFAVAYGERPSEVRYADPEERATRHKGDPDFCHYEIGGLHPGGSDRVEIEPVPGTTESLGDVLIAHVEYRRERKAQRAFAAQAAAATRDQSFAREISGVGDEAFLSTSDEENPFSDIVDGPNEANSLTARSGKSLVFLRGYFLDVTQMDAGSPTTLAVVNRPDVLAPLADVTFRRLGNSQGAITDTIVLGKGTADVAVGDGVVWVADNDDDETDTDGPIVGEHAFWRIDPTTQKATGSYRNRYFEDVAVGEDAVWVTEHDRDHVLRIDPATGKITATIDIESPEDLAVGAGAVWVAGDALYRIDPVTNTVTATIDVDAYAVAVGEGAVWAVDVDGKVARIDPATNTVTARTTDRATKICRAAAIAAGEGAVWVVGADFAGRAARIDPATTTVTTTVDLGASPEGIAVGEGAVWVADFTERSLFRLDPTTGAITAILNVGPADQVAVGEGAIWLTVEGRLLRIDPTLVS